MIYLQVENLEESLHDIALADRTVSVARKTDVTLNRVPAERKRLVKQETHIVELNTKKIRYIFKLKTQVRFRKIT